MFVWGSNYFDLVLKLEVFQCWRLEIMAASTFLILFFLIVNSKRAPLNLFVREALFVVLITLIIKNKIQDYKILKQKFLFIFSLLGIYN